MKSGFAAAAALSVVGVTSASAQVYIADPTSLLLCLRCPARIAAPPPVQRHPLHECDSAWACHPGRAGLCGSAPIGGYAPRIQLHDQQPSLWCDLLGLLARLALAPPFVITRVGEARIGVIVLQRRLDRFAQQWMVVLVPPVHVNIGQ